jgi:hypothetical protein
MRFVVHKTTLEQKRAVLTTLHLAGAKNIDNSSCCRFLDFLLYTKVTILSHHCSRLSIILPGILGFELVL